jgi:hypothetical protein
MSSLFLELVKIVKFNFFSSAHDIGVNYNILYLAIKSLIILFFFDLPFQFRREEIRSNHQINKDLIEQINIYRLDCSNYYMLYSPPALGKEPFLLISLRLGRYNLSRITKKGDKIMVLCNQKGIALSNNHTCFIGQFLSGKICVPLNFSILLLF